MTTDDAYESLRQDEQQFLSDQAKDVAMLASQEKQMEYYREQLGEFAEKWKAYKIVQEADSKGEWQPSMGRPGNPLEAIWPQFRGGMRFPTYGGIRPVLGDYALLAVIHDQILPKCPPVAARVLPKELISKIWHDLVTGANNESTSIGTPKWVIPTSKIENCLRNMKADIESHFAPEETPKQNPPASVESEAEIKARDQRLFGGLLEPHNRNIRWLKETGLPAPMNWDEMETIFDQYSIPKRVMDNAFEITDTMDSLDALDDLLIAAIKNDRKAAAHGKQTEGSKQPTGVESLSEKPGSQTKAIGTGTISKLISYQVIDAEGERTLTVPTNELPYVGDPTNTVLDIEARTRTRLKNNENPLWFIRLHYQFRKKQDAHSGVSFAEYCQRRFSERIDMAIQTTLPPDQIGSKDSAEETVLTDTEQNILNGGDTPDEKGFVRNTSGKRVLLAIGCSAVTVALFLGLAHMLPLTWLISHKNALSMQIGISATLVFASAGLVVGAWRKWCWEVGVFALFVTLLSLI